MPKKSKSSKKFSLKADVEAVEVSGYDHKMKELERHIVLDKAIKKYGLLEVLRHMNLVTNLNVGHPKAHEVLREDVEWLVKKHKKEEKKE